ncbi:STAS domain-containing protein [Streptomyces omiyaensis]|uniref:Anti-sigma factor antagonist n=1 Tax=Streptomyces omiyaensis TaxID=68247 RepID=A0ABW7BTJ7_9ACTN|nr:STAS domain-containing protein [Streptomyces omiyaensis]GGY62342.1 anti-sigma factor antagonist [Streptomyces omiyaensis]
MNEHTLTVSPRPAAPGATVLVVDGELDHHTAPLLARWLGGELFAPGARVVLDLTALTYCDSTGVTVLVGAYQKAHATGCALSLAGVNDDLTRVFTIMGLDQVFSFAPTAADALGPDRP